MVLKWKTEALAGSNSSCAHCFLPLFLPFKHNIASFLSSQQSRLQTASARFQTPGSLIASILWMWRGGLHRPRPPLVHGGGYPHLGPPPFPSPVPLHSPVISLHLPRRPAALSTAPPRPARRLQHTPAVTGPTLKRTDGRPGRDPASVGPPHGPATPRLAAAIPASGGRRLHGAAGRAGLAGVAAAVTLA